MLNNRLQEYINNPDCDLINYRVGYEYEKIGQYASAISFYLRAAERSPNKDLVYECLLRVSKCFSFQGSRDTSELNSISQAITLIPDRPEAYYYKSCYYSWRGKFQEAEEAATIGILFVQNKKVFFNPMEYQTKDQLILQKALSCKGVGKLKESLEWYKLITEDKYSFCYETAKNNVSNIGYKAMPPVLYDFTMKKNFKFQFKGIEKINRNYSQALQDMFVLYHTKGNKGTYLEIGAGHPFYGNNTALLEELGWTGVSLDYNKEMVDAFNKQRKNPCLLQDATKADYLKILKDFPKVIDYLQIDCDPAEVSLQVLKKIPFDKYQFKIITFEHDSYLSPKKEVRKESRGYLKQQGYVLVEKDVTINGKDSFEDWYIHSSLVKP